MSAPTGPFIKGQIGKVLISEKPCQSLEAMPDGYLLIVSSWWKVLPGCGGVSNQYKLTDPYGNLWWVLPVFGMWHEAVEGGSLPELNMEEMWLALVKDGPYFSLITSKHRNSFSDCLHPLLSHLSLPFPIKDDIVA